MAMQHHQQHQQLQQPMTHMPQPLNAVQAMNPMMAAGMFNPMLMQQMAANPMLMQQMAAAQMQMAAMQQQQQQQQQHQHQQQHQQQQHQHAPHGSQAAGMSPMSAGMGGMGMAPMNPMMLQMMQMQQMLMQQQQQQHHQQQQQQQQQSMGRLPSGSGSNNLTQPAVPSASLSGPMLPYNPMLPMYNPMMAQQHAMAAPGLMFNPAMHSQPPLQPPSGLLPPLPPSLPAPLSPTGSGSGPSAATPAGPDAFAALDADSDSSSLPHLPGAPLNIKAKQQTAVTPPSNRSAAPSRSSTANTATEAESEFGEFETAKTTPTPLQPHTQPPQQSQYSHNAPHVAPHMASPHLTAPSMTSPEVAQPFSLQGPPMTHMQQQQQQHMTPQQFQFMQQQHQLFLQQQQQARSSMQFPLQSAAGVSVSGVAVSASSRERMVALPTDDFGSFSSGSGARSAAAMPSNVPAVPSVREISFDPPAGATDDSDFGSFESAGTDTTQTNTTTSDDFETDFQHAAASTSSNHTSNSSNSNTNALSPPPQPQPEESGSKSAVVPPPASASMDSLLYSAFDKAFDSQKANAPLVDVPPTATLNAMQPHHTTAASSHANNTQLHRGRELPSELDDLLNSLLPDAVTHNAPLPTLPFDDRRAALQAEQDELEFDDFSSATARADNTARVDSAATAAASVDDEDDFAAFSSAPSNSQVAFGGSTLPTAQSSGSSDKTAGGGVKVVDQSAAGGNSGSSARSAQEQQIAAAIAAASKKKGGSFAFSAPPASSAAATIVTAIAPPTVAPLSFGPPPPVSIVSLSALVPPPPAAPSPVPALFDIAAPPPVAADEDDFEAEFDQPAAAAAATPFGVGAPSLVGGGGSSQQSYFDEEDDGSTVESEETVQSALHAPRDSPVDLSTSSSTSLGGSASELSGARRDSVSTLSARSTPAPAFDLLDDSNHSTALPSPSPLPVAVPSGELSRVPDDDDFAGFASADTSFARPSSLTSASSLSVAIPVSPTAITPPSPTPALPSPSASLAALSSLFSFPALPSPLPLSLSSQHSSERSASPTSALAMLLSQDRFAEWQLLSTHLKATEQLPALQSQYKEAIAASMEDEEQLPVAMALQARIKKLKAIQPKESWMRPLTLDEQLLGDGSVSALSYTQLITLLSAANITALPAFSANFPQPFAASLSQSVGGDESSLVQAAATQQYRANKQLRSVLGLLPCHRAVFASRAARVWSHIASQLAAGVAFVSQVGQLEAGSKKDSRLTAALATASSFLSSLAALYRVHLRLSLARHVYQLSDGDGSGTSTAAAVEQSWADIKRGMTKGPWKAAADKSHKQLAGVLASMEVDSLAEWQPLLLTGQTLVDTCELCLGRLDGKMKERTVQLSVATGAVESSAPSLHQLCANLWKTVGLDKLNAAG